MDINPYLEKARLYDKMTIVGSLSVIAGISKNEMIRYQTGLPNGDYILMAMPLKKENTDVSY